MNKNTLLIEINKGLSQREIGILLGVSQTTIRYWLIKFNLKTKPRNVRHNCSCGENNPSNFYGNRKSTCKKCFNKSVIKAGNDNKKYGVKYLGGECVNCGYCKSMRALEFHHIDPTLKDPNFKSLRGWSKIRLRKELDKCILLCSNCHSETHEQLDCKSIGGKNEFL